MKYIYFILSLLLLTSCTSLEKYNAAIAEMHTPAELKEDVDKTYHQLQRYHPNLYQYIDKKVLDSKFDSLKKTIVAPMSSKQFYEAIAPVVRSVGQGHISLGAPERKRTKEERKSYREKKFVFNTMSFSYVENKLFLEGVKGEDSIYIGNEIIAIDGVKPQTLIAKYNKLTATDGYNKTLYNSFVGSRFGRYYKKEHGFLDSLVITYKNRDSTFSKKYQWEDTVKKDSTAIKKDTITKVKKEKISKEERKKKKLAAKIKHKENRKYGYIHNTGKYTRSLNFIGKDSTVAHMKIRGFTNGKYAWFYEESFKILDSLGTKELIIDLRNNGGGRIADIDDLYSYLTDKPYVFIPPSEVNSRLPYFDFFLSNTNSTVGKSFAILFSPVIITHNLLKTKSENGKKYWKFRYRKEKEPNPLNFKGEIYVLINGNSFSASSIISAHLQANKRATFVGEETGGAYNSTVAGVFKRYEMPNSKVQIRMGLMDIGTPFKQEPDGYGVKADVVIKPTVADKLKGIDTELQWILNDIEAKRK